MIKSVFAATAALSMSAGAALAGPYVNVETNAGWAGDDYVGATTDIHVGYEGALGAGSYYVQYGPAMVAADGVELRLSSLVKQVLVSPSRMRLASMVRSPS